MVSCGLNAWLVILVTFTHNCQRSKPSKNAHTNAQNSAKNLKPSMNNAQGRVGSICFAFFERLPRLSVSGELEGKMRGEVYCAIWPGFFKGWLTLYTR